MHELRAKTDFAESITSEAEICPAECLPDNICLD